MKSKWFEIIGWYGVSAILAGYALSTLAIISNESLIYLLLNISGATSVGIVSYYKKNTQTLVLNIVWALIALVAIVTFF